MNKRSRYYNNKASTPSLESRRNRTILHIISQKYPDITNGMQFSDEEKTRLTIRLNEQDEKEKQLFILRPKMVMPM